jgi:6-pyruvoyltetrahydropterin/6-carboxytetrahydropterin synthase
MYSLKVEASFSAAHNLRGYKGKCEELHGHNWKVEFVVTKDKLDKTGMVLDFKYLKNKLNKVLEKLDHKYLNNVPYFKRVNPTSENIAKYIYDGVSRKGLRVKSVTVWENATCSATYEE